MYECWGVLEDRRPGTNLDNLTRYSDRHSMTHTLNDGKVVANEEIAEAEFGLQLHHH